MVEAGPRVIGIMVEVTRPIHVEYYGLGLLHVEAMADVLVYHVCGEGLAYFQQPFARLVLQGVFGVAEQDGAEGAGVHRMEIRDQVEEAALHAFRLLACFIVDAGVVVGGEETLEDF